MGAETADRIPRAVIHKRILDEASDRPEASLTALAEKIPGASINLVEKVLDEFGDPGDESQPTVDSEEPAAELNQAGPPASAGISEEGAPPAVEDLSAKQRETLRKIDEEPTATQREIGESLGVTASAISNRLSDINGFSWQSRQKFVTSNLGTTLIGDGHGQDEQDDTAVVDTRWEQIETRLQNLETGIIRSSMEPELAHKVLHACMKSDEFSESEELELIRTLFGQTLTGNE